MGKSAGGVQAAKSRKAAKKKRQDVSKVGDVCPKELAQKGEEFMEQGEFDEARKAFQASLNKQPDSNVMFLMASCLLELSRPEEAKQVNSPRI